MAFGRFGRRFAGGLVILMFGRLGRRLTGGLVISMFRRFGRRLAGGLGVMGKGRRASHGDIINVTTASYKSMRCLYSI